MAADSRDDVDKSASCVDLLMSSLLSGGDVSFCAPYR